MHHHFRFTALCLCFLGATALKVGQDSTALHRPHRHSSPVSLSLESQASETFADRPKVAADSSQSDAGGAALENTSSTGFVLVTTLVVWMVLAACLLHGPWTSGTTSSKSAYEACDPPLTDERGLTKPLRMGKYEDVVLADEIQKGFVVSNDPGIWEEAMPVAAKDDGMCDGIAMAGYQQQQQDFLLHTSPPTSMQQGVVLSQPQPEQSQHGWQESAYEVNASSSDEPFAFTYPHLNISAQDQTALTLLLKCSIISADELESNSVSQDHLAECVSIGNQMLQMKSLEEWVDLALYGPKEFQHTIAEIFEARENARLAVAHQTREHAPVGPTAVMREPLMTSSSMGRSSLNSMVSTISFGGDLPGRQSNVPTDAFPKSHKSPVPLLDCITQAEAMHSPSQGPSQGGSAKSVPSQEEGGFASVLSVPQSLGDAGSPMPTLVTLKSQQALTPPPPGFTMLMPQAAVPTSSSSFRLPAVEVMVPQTNVVPSVSPTSSMRLTAHQVLAPPPAMGSATSEQPPLRPSTTSSFRLQPLEAMVPATLPSLDGRAAAEVAADSRTSSMRLPAYEAMAMPSDSSRALPQAEPAGAGPYVLDQAALVRAMSLVMQGGNARNEMEGIATDESYSGTAPVTSESLWAERERAEEELIAAEEALTPQSRSRQ